LRYGVECVEVEDDFDIVYCCVVVFVGSEFFFDDFDIEFVEVVVVVCGEVVEDVDLVVVFEECMYEI